SAQVRAGLGRGDWESRAWVRSSLSLLIDLVDPRFKKALAGYSTENDKQTFISICFDGWGCLDRLKQL
ncbi:MAG: hypothetical protein ACRES5_31850, partial [Pseudomonas sp.]